MMGPFEVFIAMIVIGIPVSGVIYLAHRFFQLKEKKIDAEVALAAEKAAQYAVNRAELEARVRVLEQIVTDRGIETASQIEALRDRPRIASGEK